jgi:predicted nuclease with TOPRIM domain
MQFERVNELKERLKALGEELIEFKEKRHKLLNIQTEWNRAIEDKVNGLFEITKFRMSNELKNGELEDTCEAMFEGIDYNKTLNTGAKVCMTVDVANTFSREFNIDFTTIIDNSESVTDWLVKPKGQAIYLYALDDINELTMEVCNE